jgi:hypothetical protein
VKGRLTKRRWLELAVVALRPRYRRAGAGLPAHIELHVAPVPGGDAHGLWIGPPYTDPPHQVVIDSRLRHAPTVLAVLIHELCHAARPDLHERSVEFRALLSALGGWGELGTAHPGASRANARLAARLGPWPMSRSV